MADPRPTGRRVSGAALASAGWLAVALTVLYVVCVRTVTGQVHENALHLRTLATAAGGGIDWLTRVFEVTGRLQPQHLVIGFVIVGVLGVLRGRPSKALLGMAVAGATLDSTELLKLVVLSRPHLVSAATSNSLPSGHTAAVLGLTLGALVAAPHRLRAPLAVVGAVAAGSMGAYVIDVGWHRVSDVLASALVGSACLALALALPSRARRRSGRIIGLGLVVPVLCAITLAAVYAGPAPSYAVVVLVPGAVVALTVLLAAWTLPQEPGALPREVEGRR